MFGHELRLPMDLVAGQPLDMGLSTVTSGIEAALQEHLVEVHHHMQGKLKVTGQSMKEMYNRLMRDMRYAVGDKAWLHNPHWRRGLLAKLRSPWKGLYTVVAELSAVTYCIRRGKKCFLVIQVD